MSSLDWAITRVGRTLQTMSDGVLKLQDGWSLVDIMRVDRIRVRGYGYADTNTRIRIRGYGYADTDTRIRIRGYGYADTDTRIRICGHGYADTLRTLSTLGTLSSTMRSVPTECSLWRVTGSRGDARLDAAKAG